MEELYDIIFLINKTKKILDRKVKEIKDTYRTNTYRVEYLHQEKQLTDVAGLFDITSQGPTGDNTTLTLRIAGGKTINDVLAYLITMVHIHELKEVIPSIHDSFVPQVTAKTTTPINNAQKRKKK